MSNVPLNKKVATKIIKAHGITAIKYHKTDVVTIYHEHDDKTKLQSGGYRTATTKRRMNEVSREYNLGFHVFQKKGKWFVKLFDDRTVDFFDNMIIPTN